MKAALAAIAIAVALALPAVPALAQCPMCRTALEAPESAGLARAFRRAILFLLPAPFAAVGVIAVLVARETRRQPPPSVAGTAESRRSP